MNFEAVKAWLEMRNKRLSDRYRFFGILGFALCPLALAVAFAGVFVILHNYVVGWGPGGAVISLVLALTVLPLMFLINRLIKLPDPLTGPMEDGVGDSYIERKIAGYQTAGILFCWAALAGPKLFDWGLNSFRQIKLLTQQDTHSCAAVLWVLVSRPRKVPLDQFPGILDWLDLDATLPQVRQVPGLLVLKGPPAALSLSDDLRKAIRSGTLPD